MLGYSMNIIKECCGWIDARYKVGTWRFLFDCFLLVGNNYMSHPSISLQVEGLKIEAEKRRETRGQRTYVSQREEA